MAEYRTVRMGFWNDPYVESLGPEHKLLYLYLFTCPHTNNLGVLEVSANRISFESGLSSEFVASGLARFEADGKVQRDGLKIWLTRFIKHQTTTSEKLISGLKKLLPSIGSQKLTCAICERYPHLFDTVPNASIPSDTVSIGSGEREEEREEEVGKGRGNLESPDGDSSGSAHAAPSARDKKRPPCPYQEIIALYHELLPQLPTVQVFDDTAKKTMRARWSESPERQDLKFWRRVFVTVAASDFLMGRVKEWQCPGLLWIIGPKNFAKIINGHYSNHGPRTGSSLTDANMRVAQEWATEGGAPQ